LLALLLALLLFDLFAVCLGLVNLLQLLLATIGHLLRFQLTASLTDLVVLAVFDARQELHLVASLAHQLCIRQVGACHCMLEHSLSRVGVHLADYNIVVVKIALLLLFQVKDASPFLLLRLVLALVAVLARMRARVLEVGIERLVFARPVNFFYKLHALFHWLQFALAALHLQRVDDLLGGQGQQVVT